MDEEKSIETKKVINKLLFDGDLLCYKASSAVQKDIDWGDGLFTCHAYLEDAQDALYTELSDIKEDIKEFYDISNATPYFIFSGSNNFRKGLNPEYKSNRADKRKPTCYYALVYSIFSLHSDNSSVLVALSEDKLEGDDLIGIYATKYPEDSLIVSMDKDFKTVPCRFYDFGKKELSSHFEDWNYWLAYQTLVGDISDGYKGCKGVGSISAKKILSKVEPKDYWEAVLKTYSKAGMSEEDAIMNLRMAHILWNTDYDFDSKEINLINNLQLTR